ncbi:hypothetical protein AWENTII_010611 [Aspergillus wentii]|nr:hypothetical protein MW887_009777 [Aspergillus wentii]
MALTNLPNEIILSIADGLDKEHDINALAQTCRRLYAALDCLLYQHNVEHNQSSGARWAVKYNFESTLLKFLEQGANVDDEMVEGQSELSSEEEDSNQGYESREICPEPRRRWYRFRSDYINYRMRVHCFKPLVFLAAKKRYVGVLRLLLLYGASPNTKSRYGESPLSIAASRGYKDIVEILLQEEDVRPNIRDNGRRGLTPLARAAASGHEEIVNLLLARKDINPDPTYNIMFTPLVLAIKSIRPSMVKRLLDHGVNPTAKHYDNGILLLSLAATYSNEAIVRILLEKGLEPNAPDHDGLTPILKAARAGREEIVKIFLEMGINLSTSKTANGRTALHLIHTESARFAQFLLDSGVDPNCPDRRGRTPLHEATHCRNGEVVDCLLKNGANPNMQDNTGSTPLLEATKFRRNGSSRVISLLLESGADPDIPNHDGLTALAQASRGRFSVIVQMLTEASADLHSHDHSGRTPSMRAKKNSSFYRYLLDNTNGSNENNVKDQTAASQAKTEAHSSDSG